MRNWQAHVTAAALGLVLAAPVAAVTVGDMRALSAVGEPLQLDIGLADAFDVRDGDITVGVAVGMAVFPDDATDAQTLMHHADAAMYRMKRLEGAR